MSEESTIIEPMGIRRTSEVTAEERAAVGATRKNLRRIIKGIKAEKGRKAFRRLTRRKNREEMTTEVASWLVDEQPKAFAMAKASYEAEMAIFDGNREWDGSFLRAILDFIKELMPILLRFFGMGAKPSRKIDRKRKAAANAADRLRALADLASATS